MNRILAILAAALMLGASALALADEPPAKGAPAKSKAAAREEPTRAAVVSKKSAQLGKPPAELQKLAVLLGSWNGETHAFAGPDAKNPSKATYKWTFNGMHLEGDHQYTMNGKPFYGRSTWGYDPDRNQYQCVWTDEMSSSASIFTGSFTDEKTLFLSSTSVVDGKPITEVMTLKFDEPGKYDFVMTSDASGDPKPVMEETASKSGGPAEKADQPAKKEVSTKNNG